MDNSLWLGDKRGVRTMNMDVRLSKITTMMKEANRERAGKAPNFKNCLPLKCNSGHKDMGWEPDQRRDYRSLW